MNAKCRPLSRTTVGGQLRPDEVVSMLDAGYQLADGRYCEPTLRRAAANGDMTTRWTILQQPSS